MSDVAVIQTGARRRESEVLQAAAHVFAEHGFHGATTQAIADRLGIRQASLYYYVRSKEQALESVCLHGVEAFIGSAQEIAQSDRAAPAKVAALMRAHLRPLEVDREFTFVFINERRYLDAPRRRAVNTQARKLERIWQDVVEEGVRSGAFRSDANPRLVVLSALGMLNSVCAWYGREPMGGVDAIGAAMTNMLLSGIEASVIGPQGGLGRKRKPV